MTSQQNHSSDSPPTSDKHYVPWPVRMLARFLFYRVAGWRSVGNPRVVEQAVVLAVPHTSNMDGPLAFTAAFSLDVRFRWVGKHTLFRGPLGPISRLLGGLPVDRRSSKGYVDQIAEYFERYPNFFLIIAPEGTRSRVEYWKSGFYYIALKAKVPLIIAKPQYFERTVYLDKFIYPSGDIEADMEIIRAYLADAKGHKPENFGPVRLRPKDKSANNTEADKGI